MSTTPRQALARILSVADIKINGTRPWDITVKNDNFYSRALSAGSLGVGEAYMDAWWECRHLDELFFRVLRTDLKKAFDRNIHAIRIYLHAKLLNMQSRSGSSKIARVHYDLPSEFYELFLGPYNQYTCLYYKNTEDLERAEVQRLDLICRKLRLKKSDAVLDIGCGWGGFAKYAAQKYGCHVVGITISKEQAAYARRFTKGLPVTIKVMDYRDLPARPADLPAGRHGLPRSKKLFSKIFSGGMIEHVGAKNYRAYMKIIDTMLVKDGVFVLDCLGANLPEDPDPWFHTYIFPNSQNPAPSQITMATEGLFVIEDWHNFGADYDKTCMDWYKQFNKNWSKIQKISPQFDKRFYRMWKYYLLAAAGALRARHIQQWQIVFTRGLLGGYPPER